jgi:putative FmdB family regulatory protein
MPIYEYACGSCGKEFEALVRSSSAAPECPACHGSDLHKKLSAPAAISGAGASRDPMPGPCGSCGNPGGPGSCRFN